MPEPTPAPAPDLRDQIAAALHDHFAAPGMRETWRGLMADYRATADAVLAVPAIRALTETRDALRVTEGDRDGADAEAQQLRDKLEDLRHNLALRAFTAPDADFETILTSLDARIRDALNATADGPAGSDEAARRAMEQRQEMATERYAWQERGDRAEAAGARVAAECDAMEQAMSAGHASLSRLRTHIARIRDALNPQEPS